MRILVAEGDAPLAEAFREQLAREQFAAQTVSDGFEVQRLAADQFYDLVILDLDLPGAGDLEVFDRHGIIVGGRACTWTGRGRGRLRG